MTPVDDDIKFGMIEAISHLIHRGKQQAVAPSASRTAFRPRLDYKISAHPDLRIHSL